ncbi:MAG: putative anti-sigma-YlaC factor YlaD [Nitriliruptoraceae bacterium]|jgi:predicted anti-sigma-YlaC factor YlaD
MDTSCTTYREALSARIDGERHELRIEVVDAHVLGRAACTSFSAGLPMLGERVAALLVVPIADGTAGVLAAAGAARLRAPGRAEGELRGLLGLAASVQLVLALVALSSIAGDHIARDLVMFELAAAGGLAAAAWRPVFAVGLLPMVALAALAGVVAMGIDISTGTSTLAAELPHFILAVAVWPLLALARRQGLAATVASR